MSGFSNTRLPSFCLFCPMFSLHLTFVLFPVILVLCLLLHRRKQKIPLRNYPPGPPPRWIIGNLHQFPKRLPWVVFAEWAKTYGPVFMLKSFQRTLIVLNDADSIIEILDKQSSISSDRPTSWMIGELVGRKYTVFLTSSLNPRHRIYRKMLHSSLNPRRVLGYKDLLEDEVGVLVRLLLDNPDDPVAHLRRNAGSVILRLAYGYSVKSDNDKFIQIVENGLKAISSISLGMQALVDGLPALRFLPAWLPFASFQRVAQHTKSLSDRIERVPFEWTQREMGSSAKHSIEESFVSQHLSSSALGCQEQTEDMVKWCAAALYSGGADTTVSILTSFLYLMAHNPEVQKCAQEEIDGIVGTSRSPVVEDQVHLPYCKAVLREVMRWGPVTPLALQHRLMEDTTYNNMYIPKGSVIIPNIWAVFHDPTIYPHPSQFRPERHLGEHPQLDPYGFVWGFGRRICPGMHLAEVSMMLTMSTILSTFEISPPEKGVERNVEWSGIMLSHLTNMKCRLTRRKENL